MISLGLLKVNVAFIELVIDRCSYLAFWYPLACGDSRALALLNVKYALYLLAAIIHFTFGFTNPHNQLENG